MDMTRLFLFADPDFLDFTAGEMILFVTFKIILNHNNILIGNVGDWIQQPVPKLPILIFRPIRASFTSLVCIFVVKVRTF